MIQTDFCKGWEYSRCGTGERIPVTLPHDAMIHEKRDPECESGSAGAYFPGGVYEYVKTFDVPGQWKGKIVLIRFEGVYRRADVSVNGTHVGRIVNGYTERIFDLSAALNYGAENEIKVVLDNSEVPNSRWYSGSGIYRPVTLFVLDQVHMEPDGVRVSTVSCNPARIAVLVKHVGGEAVGRRQSLPVHL